MRPQPPTMAIETKAGRQLFEEADGGAASTRCVQVWPSCTRSARLGQAFTKLNDVNLCAHRSKVALASLSIVFRVCWFPSFAKLTRLLRAVASPKRRILDGDKSYFCTSKGAVPTNSLPGCCCCFDQSVFSL